MPILRMLPCLLLCLLAACADTDPYKRLEPAPTPALNTTAAAQAFNSRWPAQFKCVHTVTIDFRVMTQTLIGYLVVQAPDRFRLQGMTEQGIRLFELVEVNGKRTVLYKTDEIEDEVIAAVCSDVSRIFLDRWDPGRIFFENPEDGTDVWPGSVEHQGDRARATVPGRYGHLTILLSGDPPLVDWYSYTSDVCSRYRVDHYEWQDFAGIQAPSIVVLREQGSPSYKLTLRITELEARSEPWPESLFAVEGE